MKTTLSRHLLFLVIVRTIAGAALAEDTSTVRADSQTVARAISTSMSEHARLSEAVEFYASKLLAGDWEALYALYSPLFRRQNRKDEFVKAMVSASYHVTEYEVKRYIVDDRAARLVVRIADSESARRFGIALWGKHRDGRWYCIDDGTQFIRSSRILFGGEDLLSEMAETRSDSDAVGFPEESDSVPKDSN